MFNGTKMNSSEQADKLPGLKLQQQSYVQWNKNENSHIFNGTKTKSSSHADKLPGLKLISDQEKSLTIP